MPLIPKPNYNQIFASQAPDQDKPAVFNNYPEGWGVESRPNNGKPTIKGFNYLQQTSDLKDLWILQNGACLPYDESIEYADGAPVLKDGVIQYKTASGFKSRDAVTIPTYNSAADGVDPVTGVVDGAYFNVRSSSVESYGDEYRNVGGSAVATGRSYSSARVVVVDNIADLLALPAGQRREGLRYLVKGYHAGTDIGGGEFYWESSRVTENDGGIVLDGFVRVLVSDVNVNMFGAVGDGDTDDTVALQKAVNYGNFSLRPGRNYKILGTITVSENLIISGNNAKISGGIGNRLFNINNDCTISLNNVQVSDFDRCISTESDIDVSIANCSFSDIDLFLNTRGEVSLRLRATDTVFKNMRQCVDAPVLVQVVMFTRCEFLNFLSDPVEHNINSYILRVGKSDYAGGSVFIKSCRFEGMRGGMTDTSGSAYIVPIFTSTDELLVDGCVFKDVENAQGALKGNSRSIYSYGIKTTVSNNVFHNAGSYSVVTIKGYATKNTAVIANNIIITTGAVEVSPLYLESATDCTVTGNIIEGVSANARLGSSGSPLDSAVVQNNIFKGSGAVGIISVGVKRLKILSNDFYKSGVVGGVDDNMIHIFSSSTGNMSDAVVIADNSFHMPDTPSVTSQRRSFVLIRADDSPKVDSLIVKGNTFYSTSPYPYSLTTPTNFEGVIFYLDNMTTSVNRPRVSSATKYTGMNNFYDSEFEQITDASIV